MILFFSNLHRAAPGVKPDSPAFSLRPGAEIRA